MFRSPKHYRTFLTILMTYTLDLVGYSIVFPVLAPLLLNPQLHYFVSGTPEAAKTTVLGLLFAAFGIAQFFGAPVAGALADHYGRYRVFLVTIGCSIFGYLILALGVYEQSIVWLFTGRILTGFCSGNFSLAQSATADLTDDKHRSKAFGILLGMGGLGFVIGPWIGGKLANPDWMFGSAAFIFAAVAAVINFLIVLFFFVETWHRKEDQDRSSLFNTFKDIRFVFHHRIIRTILIASLLFYIGWSFFIVFFPTYLVQRFTMNPDKIGDIFAYMAIIWSFVTMYLNKILATKFSLRTLALCGAPMAFIGVALMLLPDHLWPYWAIIPIPLAGGALCWVCFNSLLSMRATASMQGRALGVNGSMWSLGQILGPLIAGPLAGWNIYSPLLVGAGVIALSFVYFIVFYKEK